MRSGNFFIIALCLLFLFKGTGVYAMVHCQSQQHQSSVTFNPNEAAEQMSSVSHYHASSSTTDPSLHISVDNTNLTSAEPCEACDHCCSIHCVPLPELSAAAEISCHDKVLQNTYFHTSGIVLPQERPPKTV